MPNKFYVYPYKQGSKSAKALATSLGGKVLRIEGSTFQPRQDRKVINWGSSSCPYDCLNPPDLLQQVTNKLSFFQKVSETEEPFRPRVPIWTTSRATAKTYLEGREFRKVVARTVLTGHSGNGIFISDLEGFDDLPEAPLYVEYVPKDEEYRVHVFNEEVIDVQRKVRDPSREPINWQVRSHSNGFIYTRTSATGASYTDIVRHDVKQQALKALAMTGLTFGAVDVIYNANRNQAFVLEINSACGLEGATVGIYRDAIIRYFS